MKRTLKILTVIAFTMLVSVPQMYAGNDKRRGTAGATELLIQPWARGAGWGCVNVAGARGLDALFTNVAGLAFLEKTEFSYTNTMLYGGKNGLNSGASINSIGLGRRVGDAGVLGAYVMVMNFGDLPVTTVESPTPGSNGYFSPSLMNLNVAYSHSFTNTIRGGVNIKVITESTSDISATGVGIDAGIQYVTGENDEIKFGIALKNIGPAMSFSGTGMSLTLNNSNGIPMSVELHKAEIELPTLLAIGASYDFLIEKFDQKITVAASFTSNAFLRDNFSLGVEYSFLKRFYLRAAYVGQSGIFDADSRVTANRGLSAGASVEFPLSKNGNQVISIDYAYKDASPLRGTHAIGATVKF